jgi:hypothetical protein
VETTIKSFRRALLHGAAGLALAAAGAAYAQEVSVKLSGDAEVPPVATKASGTGTIKVGPDKSVSGAVSTTGIEGTAAHIHEGAAGKNGGVAVPLEKGAGGKWSVPAGVKLTDAQFDAFKAGNLYVNVHSAANPSGEIRAQMKP